MEKIRKQQSLLRIVHGGQPGITSGPLTPIIDESPRNSVLLSSNASSTVTTPVETPNQTPVQTPSEPKHIQPLKWNQSDSEVGQEMTPKSDPKYYN